MASLILEDGSGVLNSTSYVDVDFADYYLGSNWAPSLEEKEQALVQASEYVDIRWGSLFKGIPATATQLLALPRLSFTDGNNILITGIIPVNIKKAVCLYAKEFLKGTLYPDTTQLNAPIKRESVVAGPIQETIEYFDKATQNSSPWLQFPLADALITPFLTSVKSNPVVRVIR